MNAMRNSRTICEYCSTGFACARLGTALRFLEADGWLRLDPEERDLFATIKRKLADAGWAFPSGGHHCQLVGKREEVRALTDELIGLLDASRTKSFNATRSLYDEEATGE